MKPSIDQHLMALTGVLATKIAPAIPDGNYAAGDAKMSAALALMLAQEVDRRADTVWRENSAMRTLFLEAARLELPDILRRQVNDAQLWDDSSLRISALEANHDKLSRLLIALHATIECDADPAFQRLNAAIWDFLEQSAIRRELVLPAI